MKKSVSLEDFREEFRIYNRDNFSYKGQEILFNYLEEVEEDCNVEFELDVIALCCDWNEDTLSSVLEDYRIESLEELQDNTIVLIVEENGEDTIIIYQAF